MPKSSVFLTGITLSLRDLLVNEMPEFFNIRPCCASVIIGIVNNDFVNYLRECDSVDDPAIFTRRLEGS